MVVGRFDQASHMLRKTEHEIRRLTPFSHNLPIRLSTVLQTISSFGRERLAHGNHHDQHREITKPQFVCRRSIVAGDPPGDHHRQANKLTGFLEENRSLNPPLHQPHVDSVLPTHSTDCG